VKYAVFLRAINVGGKNVVRMADLKTACEAAGLAGVSTYLQSGNVLFESDADADALTAQIESLLAKLTGNEISAMLRSEAALRRIIELDPFAGVDTEDSHRYVTFLRTARDPGRELPLATPRGDLKVLRVTLTEVYSIPYEVGGRFGQPGAFVEAKLSVRTTTRNWAVVKSVAQRLVQ
jgi:uncharacterized protein (DUF1697 family)